jgi:hypothetical protein
MDLNTILEKKTWLEFKKNFKMIIFLKNIIVIMTHWIDFNPPTTYVINSIDFNNFFINYFFNYMIKIYVHKIEQ